MFPDPTFIIKTNRLSFSHSHFSLSVSPSSSTLFFFNNEADTSNLQSMDKVVAQLKLTVLVVFAFYLLLPSIQAKDVKYCDNKGSYAVKVKGVEISPDPVKPGQSATFKISASTGQAISGGEVVIQVSYFGVRVRTETHDLCEETSCPIAASNFVLSHTQSLPGFTPPGSYTLKMNMKDKKGHQLTCISFNFKIGLGSFLSDS